MTKSREKYGCITFVILEVSEKMASSSQTESEEEVFIMAKEKWMNARKRNFTMISNDVLNQKEMSLQAKGLLAILLSNSDEWEINMKEIMTRSKNGRDVHYKAVQELEVFGYVSRIQVKEGSLYTELIYVFSDDPKEVAEMTEEIMKDLKQQGKIAYIKKKSSRKSKRKSQFPENQEPKNQFPEIQDPENQDSNFQERDNNTNYKNTNQKNSSKYVVVDNRVFQEFEKRFDLTKCEKIELEILTEEYGETFAIEAIKRAAKSKAQNPISYIEGVLKNWKNAGLKTPEEIQAYEEAYREEQKRKKQKRKQQTAIGNPAQKPAEFLQGKLPKAILEQMEQAQKEAAATAEEDKPLTEAETLEEKQKRIQAKIQMMRA